MTTAPGRANCQGILSDLGVDATGEMRLHARAGQLVDGAAAPVMHLEGGTRSMRDLQLLDAGEPCRPKAGNGRVVRRPRGLQLRTAAADILNRRADEYFAGPNA